LHITSRKWLWIRLLRTGSEEKAKQQNSRMKQ